MRVTSYMTSRVGGLITQAAEREAGSFASLFRRGTRTSAASTNQELVAYLLVYLRPRRCIPWEQGGGRAIKGQASVDSYSEKSMMESKFMILYPYNI